MSVRKMDDFDVGILQKEQFMKKKDEQNWNVQDVSTWKTAAKDESSVAAYRLEH
jgi:hypothetical protein